MNTFKHSGDLGDIIFALPTVRALGGGVLYLDPNGGESDPLVKWPNFTRTKLNRQSIEFIRPLLLEQDYISDVRFWQGEPVQYNLDKFRQHIRFNNLADSHLAAFNLPLTNRDQAWINPSNPIVLPGRPLVASRSLRYQGNHDYWQQLAFQLVKDGVFLGLPRDHEIFEYTFDIEIPHVPTPDSLSMAEIIAGATLFVCNQGLPHAIAEGMKKRLVVEVFRPYPAVVFARDGATYV